VAEEATIAKEGKMIDFEFTNAATAHMFRNHIEPFDLLGFLPEMLSNANPDPAVKQLDDGYTHHGGWRKFEGFTLNDTDPEQPTLEYEGEPPVVCVAIATLHKHTEQPTERVMLFENSWVAVVQEQGLIEVSRMS
jgi:hypothetical protein